MPLVEQRVSFPVTAGQEQELAPELVDPPVLLKAHNVVYTRTGELTKRRGWVTAPFSVHGYPYLPLPERLARRQNEVLWIGQTVTTDQSVSKPPVLLSRVIGETDDSTPPPIWLAKSELPRFNTRTLVEISHSNVGVKIGAWDCAFAGDARDRVFSSGVICVVWRTPVSDTLSRIEYAAIDVATKSVLAQGILTQLAWVDSIVRVVAIKHADLKYYFHIFYATNQVDSACTVKRVTIDASAPWGFSEEAIVWVGASGFDACVTDPTEATERRLFMVITRPAQSAIYAQMHLPQANGTLYLQTSSTLTFTSIVNCIPCYWTIMCVADPTGTNLGCHLSVLSPGCVGTPANIIATYTAGEYPDTSLTPYSDVVSALGFDVATELAVGGLQIGWAGTRYVSSVQRQDNWWISWERPPSNWGIKTLLYLARSSAPLVGETPSLSTMSLRPWGRPFTYRGQCYSPVVRGVSPDTMGIEFIGSYRVGIDGGDPSTEYRVAGRCLSGEIAFAGSLPYNVPFCRGHNSIVESYYDRGRFFGAFPTVSLDGTEHKLTVVDIDARDPQQFAWTEAAGGTYIASSIPWCYDGGTGHEIGFPCRPQSAYGEISLGTQTSTDALPAGNYYVAACWESIDSLGRVARSAPSKSGPIAVAAGKTIVVTYLNLCTTTHRSARLVLYVSKDGGENHYRSKQIILNRPHQDNEDQAVIEASKCFLAGMPTLYTDQKIMSNATPPAMRFVCEWQGRLWGVNDRLVYPSREIISGEEVAFNEAMYFQVPYETTGIAPYDDRLIIFCENAIYWVSGDGPTDTGEGGSFSQPQRVPTDFGCIDARSIVRTENGICFQSRRGIELLDRSLSTQPISGGVHKIMREDGYSEVIASSWDPEEQICRFVVRKPGMYVHMILCWHTLRNLWTTASVPGLGWSARTDLPAGIVRAFERNFMALGDRPAYGYAPICALAQESKGPTGASYLDGRGTEGSTGGNGSEWYQAVIETANVKLDGLTGFARVWKADILLKDRGPYTGIAIGYAVDYALSESSTFREWKTEDDVAAGATQSPNHWRYAIHVDKQQCSAIRLIIKDLRLDGQSPLTETRLSLAGFGFLWGQEPGTGRGRERSKK